MELSSRETIIFLQFGVKADLSPYDFVYFFSRTDHKVVTYCPSAKNDWLTGGKNQFCINTKMRFLWMNLFVVCESHLALIQTAPELWHSFS